MRVVGPAELFSRLNNQLPGWYARRHLSTREVARMLGLDDSTIRQQAGAGVLKGRRTERGWVFGIRDVSDYIADGRWRGARSVRPWTAEEINELLATGTCRSRTRNAIKIMKWRLKHAADQNHSTPLQRVHGIRSV